MADTWFRFHNTAVDHPKTLKLSDAHFRAWVCILSLASKLGGAIPDDIQMIAHALRKSQSKAREAIDALVKAVLLDPVEGGGWVPHNWGVKQFKSDVSTERVKRFRERSRNTVSETPHSTETETEAEREDARASALFSQFWSVCPKKEGATEAKKAWLKAVKIAAPESIIAAMQNYAAKVASDDQKYTKTPTKWLQEKRWEDEIPGAPKALSAEEIAANQDRRDRLLRQGKYAPSYQ